MLNKFKVPMCITQFHSLGKYQFNNLLFFISVNHVSVKYNRNMSYFFF